MSICLITKLLMFNEGSKESHGESVQVSQNRAALFDMTFLMLVYMVQCFKSSVVLQEPSPCFFFTSACSCMAEPGMVGGGGKPGGQPGAAVQPGEVRTQVKWHITCVTVCTVL